LPDLGREAVWKQAPRVEPHKRVRIDARPSGYLTPGAANLKTGVSMLGRQAPIGAETCSKNFSSLRVPFQLSQKQNQAKWDPKSKSLAKKSYLFLMRYWVTSGVGGGSSVMI
jgi:hypothetical protein